MKTKFNILFAALAALGGCSLAPAYKTPNMPVAQTWGEEDIYQTQKNFDVQAMALESFIRDERLLQIIRTALSDNRDLKSRLVDAQAARALYQTERAKLLPSIYAGGSGGEAKTRAAGKEKNYTGEVGLSAFELDLFGKNRSAKNSKKEQYFARLEEVRSAEILLTAQTASAWVTLASDREMLKIARETVKSAQESANIAKRRFEAGVTSKLDLYQAQTILHQAQADVADYTAVVAQDRHALELLAGGAVSEELLPSDLEQVHEWFGDVQAGTSSSVLLHRPDIRAAEHTLKSANADIGAARAEFFPVISLVAATGLASAELSKLFSDASSVWSYMGDIN
ncbi:MAG: efflux transporter outer membrane subunit, partial [Candidatus Avelusimicrobium sp.]